MLRCQYAIPAPLGLALQRELDQVIVGLAALLEAAHLKAVPGCEGLVPLGASCLTSQVFPRGYGST